MGEAKRRKATLGDKYGQEPSLVPWLPLTKSQAQEISKWVNRSTWIGIGLLVVFWVSVRFIGPAFGWW
ncbi:DUF2839 domain-containing protein, partial [Planktothrix sp. FACHB-1355]